MPERPIAEEPPELAASVSADDAVVRLVEHYGGPMYQLAVRLCGRHEDAQDLVQEVFLRAHRGWDSFQGRSAVKTWLFTIAARACQRLKRPRAGQPPVLESLDELLPFGESGVAMLPARTRDPGTLAGHRETQERLEAAIAALPLAFRVPLLLRDVLELSIDEVAGVLGVRPQTVKTRVHRARLQVRQALTSVLPRRSAPPTPYARQVCLDLLNAKQEALDRNAPFPVGNRLVCERCRGVFASLDWGRDLCRQLGDGGMPPETLRRLRKTFSGTESKNVSLTETERRTRMRTGGLQQKRTGALALAILLVCGATRGEEASWTLEACIGAALAGNPGVEVARQRLVAAAAAEQQARAAYYPSVGASAAYGRTDNPPQAFMMTLNQRTLTLDTDFNNPEDAENLRLSLGGRYLLYDGGRRGFGVESAAQTRAALSASWSATRNGLIHEVTRAYYGVLQAQATATIQEDAVLSLAESRRVAAERLEAGAAVRADLLNMDVQLADAQDGLIRASNGVLLAVAGLNRLLGGTRVGDPGKLRDDAAEVEAPLVDAEATVEARPELAAAEAMVAARRGQWRRSQRAYVPSISAFGSLDWDDDLSSTFEESYFAGVMAEVDLFTGFRRGGASAQGLAELRAAEAEADDLERQLRYELQSALLQRAEAWGRLDVAGQAMASAEEALRLTRERYAGGAADVVELITAESGFRASRMRQISARYDYRVALSNVDRARGVLAARYVDTVAVEEEAQHE